MTDIIDVTSQPVDSKPAERTATPGAAKWQGHSARAGRRGTWPWSAADLRANTAHLDAAHQTLLSECALWCIQRDISRTEFAEALGVNPITIYKICAGTYTNAAGDRIALSPEMIAKMGRWLADQRLTHELDKDFVVTPTACAVQRACTLAVESRTPVFVQGPSHIGKTMALDNYRYSQPHGRVIYVRLSLLGGHDAMLAQLIAASGAANHKTRAGKLANIITALKADMLIIWDEAHELMHNDSKVSFFASMETIREIYDRVGCGMVLVFTDTNWDKIAKYKQDDLQQLYRRGVHKIALGTEDGMPLLDDVALILEHAGLEMPHHLMPVTVTGTKSQPLAKPIATRPWDMLTAMLAQEGIKSLTERLRYAGTIAAKDGEALSWEYLALAHLAIAKNATKEKSWVRVK